jgi:hypothetical protein
MTKEIKYCLTGAIITFIISAIFGYFEILPAITTMIKFVYIACSFGLVYFVIRLLAKAEVHETN